MLGATRQGYAGGGRAAAQHPPALMIMVAPQQPAMGALRRAAAERHQGRRRFDAGGGVFNPSMTYGGIAANPVGALGQSAGQDVASAPGNGLVSLGTPGRLGLMALGMVPGPIGMLGTLAGLGVKGYNVVQTDHILGQENLPGLNIGQMLGGMLGLNSIGQGEPGLVSALASAGVNANNNTSLPHNPDNLSLPGDYFSQLTPSMLASTSGHPTGVGDGGVAPGSGGHESPGGGNPGIGEGGSGVAGGNVGIGQSVGGNPGIGEGGAGIAGGGGSGQGGQGGGGDGVSGGSTGGAYARGGALQWRRRR